MYCNQYILLHARMGLAKTTGSSSNQIFSRESLAECTCRYFEEIAEISQDYNSLIGY